MSADVADARGPLSMRHAKAPTARQKRLQERRPVNEAAVALANKMAKLRRQSWPTTALTKWVKQVCGQHSNTGVRCVER